MTWWRRPTWAALAAIVIVAASCGDAPAAEGAPGRADGYTAVLAWALSDLPAGDVRPIAYVVAIGPAGIDLEDQVKVIDSLATELDIRFVDDHAQVLDMDAPGAPPVDEAVLVGLDDLDETEPGAMRVEVYRSSTDVDAWVLSVEIVGEAWVVGDVEAVIVEDLVVPAQS